SKAKHAGIVAGHDLPQQVEESSTVERSLLIVHGPNLSDPSQGVSNTVAGRAASSRALHLELGADALPGDELFAARGSLNPYVLLVADSGRPHRRVDPPKWASLPQETNRNARILRTNHGRHPD